MPTQKRSGAVSITHYQVLNFKGSVIVLAGANKQKANPNDDGYLTALEITKLDWQGTELAVISGFTDRLPIRYWNT